MAIDVGVEAKFTPRQVELADILKFKEIVAPFTRREGDVPSEYNLVVVKDEVLNPITIARNPYEFALAVHREKLDYPLSGFYANLRNLGEDLNFRIAEQIAELRFPQQPTVFATIPSAGDAFGPDIEKLMGIPRIMLLDKHENGAKDRKIIQNPNAPHAKNGDTLLLVDDVFSGSVTKKLAAEIARPLGYRRIVFATLIDREEMGVEILENDGHQCVTVFGMTRLANYYLDSKLISPEQYKRFKDSQEIYRKLAAQEMAA